MTVHSKLTREKRIKQLKAKVKRLERQIFELRTEWLNANMKTRTVYRLTFEPNELSEEHDELVIIGYSHDKTSLQEKAVEFMNEYYGGVAIFFKDFNVSSLSRMSRGTFLIMSIVIE